MLNMPKIVIYARKSTESEDRQILSIDSQVKELREFAKRENLPIASVFTESKSAKSPGRPIFGRILKFVNKGEIDGILCWKLDRLARNPVDGGALIWAVEEGKLKNIYTPQRTFLNTGNDKFWMQLEFGMAKKYVDDLSDNVKRGLRAKIQQGWVPSLAPLGYLNDKNAGTIIKDPDRFTLVRRMWDLMLKGDSSPHKILEIATEKWGFRTRKFKRAGGGPVARSAIYKLFQNPFYYGSILYHGELFPGRHKPMITKSEFDRVQEMLSQTSNTRPKGYSFAFTGLIKCGECGASITAEHKTNRQGHKYVYYHCTKRKPHAPCNQKVIERKKVEGQIADFLSQLSITPGIKDWTIKLLRELHDEERQKDQASLESLTRRQEAIKTELDELINMKLRGLLSDEEFARKKNELEIERIKTAELLDDNDNRFDQVYQRSEEPFEFAQVAQECFAGGTIEEKRAILSYTGSNLILKDRILNIEAQKPLFKIKKLLESDKARKFMFEPRPFALAERKKVRSGSALAMWCALVDDVRTYYWENRTKLEWLALPAILKSKAKK